MIDPALTSTISVGQLPTSPWAMSDLIPHEVLASLKQGNVQGLADLIKDYIGTVSSLAFNPTTISDGETLPATSTNEWVLVGKGTFGNVGGAPDITTTEELNALTSNGVFWSLSVQIPINVELAGIVQTIRSGFTTTAPSENAVYDALLLKANISDLPTQPIIRKQFTANGIQTDFDISLSTLATMVFWDGVPLNINDWSQTGTIITLTFTPSLNALIQII